MAISTIYKEKGMQKILKNYRGIFLTQVLSKIYEKLLKGRNEEKVNKINKLQAGARQQRSCADQIFLLRSCIDHRIYLNQPLYTTYYDVKQCFDSMWLEDCLISLWNLETRDQTLSSILDLNKVSNIVVKTPLGPTENFQVPSIVKQGTVLGPTLCSASTAEYIEENKSGGLEIGGMSINSLVFVDDITNINTKIEEVHESHESLVWFMEKKRLILNEDK